MPIKAHVPAIRFAGFTEEWEQHEFSSVFDCTVPNNTLSRAALNGEEGSVRDVHYGDVLTKFGSILDVTQAGLPFITGKCETDFKGCLLQDGDIILADTAEDETVGKGCEIANSQGSSVVSGLHTIVCRPRRAMASGYLGYYINSDAYHQQLRPFMQGIKVLSLSRSNILKTYIQHPAGQTEQQQISTYFRQIDGLIDLYQRKYVQLCSIRKSMLEKMFPKEGADAPEIRFAGFTGAWERRRLGELVERIVRKNTNHESSLPLTISAQYGLVDQITYFNNRVASKDISSYYLVYNGEFAYNKSTSDGFPFGAVKRLDRYEKGVLSTLYIVFSIKNQAVDSDFLSVFFDTDRWHKGVSERAAEGARNHGLLNISAEDFFDIDLFLPRSQEEQQKISTFLRHLDRLVALHQRQLEHLQHIKKSCLEKMFV